MLFEFLGISLLTALTGSMTSMRQLTFQECYSKKVKVDKDSTDAENETETCCWSNCTYSTANKQDMSRHITFHLLQSKDYSKMTQPIMPGASAPLLSAVGINWYDCFPLKRRTYVFGGKVEDLLMPYLSIYLGMPVTRNGWYKSLDCKVGDPKTTVDRLEIKSTHSSNGTMPFDEDKLYKEPRGRLWMVFSNRTGAWIMEYSADFKTKYGPPVRWPNHDVPVYEVPIADMTQWFLYRSV